MSPIDRPAGPAPARGFKEAVRVCLAEYVTFSGRASRSEYWYFALATWLAVFAANAIDMLLFGTDFAEGGILAGLVALATLLPTLAVTSRRFHDAGWSFWWYLLVLVPILGWLFTLVLTVLRPEPGPNRFG